jgi:hypothetical protein
MLLRLWATLFLTLMACASARADSLPFGFKANDFNGSGKPVTKGGITTFQIFDQQCSKVNYHDDRGESDCTNGAVRSSAAYSPQAKMGQTLEYRFDIQVNSDFTYAGYPNTFAEGFYPDGWDSRLRIASWEGPLLHNFLYMIKVDARNGVSFLARQCQAPDKFGSWLKFSMKIHWASDNTGWIKVNCDDRIIYADEGIATDQPPQCYITNICEPDIIKHPKNVLLVLGPVMAGFGYEWQKYGLPSPFTPIQKNGITIRFRNISIAGGAVEYDQPDKILMQHLQERLTALGCDPGPADGKASQRTRDAAISCRRFPAGVLPDKLTVSTAKVFLDAYNEAGVADFARGGTLLDAPKVDTLIGEILSEKQGHQAKVASYLRVKSSGFDGPLDFGVSGMFNYNNAAFDYMQLSVDLNINKTQIKALDACGVSVDVLKRGGFKTEVTINRLILVIVNIKKTSLTFPRADCALAALPVKERNKVAFLLMHFRDIAIGIVKQGRLNDFNHDGLEIFFKRVAMGEILLAP